MRHLSFNEAIEFDGEFWPVNAKVSGIDNSMVRVILAQNKAMLSYHSKVIMIRFDLRQYEELATSKHVTRFMVRLKRNLERSHKIKRMGYAWAREAEQGENQHYHVAVFLDGHVFRHSDSVIKAARYCWEGLFDGSVFVPDNCFYRYGRADVAGQKDAIYRASYLAKGRGKCKKPKQAKNYGASRLKVAN